MPASITPESLRVVIVMMDDAVWARYLSGAAVTLVIYDWFLLIRTEQETIWQSKWTFAKFLYYFIRIFTLPFIIFAAYNHMDFRPPLSDTFCEIWPSLISLPMFFTFATSNWLFTLRLIALYKHQRTLVWFMRVFYTCTYGIALSFALVSLVLYHRIGVYYNPVAKCCFSTHTIPWTAPVFYTPALYEFLIFAMTAYRAHKDAVILSAGGTKLLVVLYRDNIIAFFIMLAMRSWNIWIFATQGISTMHKAMNIYWAVGTILSTRVYLNIVWLLAKPVADTHLSTDMEFSSGSSGPGHIETIGGTPAAQVGLAKKGKAPTTSGSLERRTPLDDDLDPIPNSRRYRF